MFSKLNEAKKRQFLLYCDIGDSLT